MADHHPPGSAPANQRAHERLPLQKNALLIARGMKQRPCQMKDICTGGALLELVAMPGAETRDFQRGEVILLRTLLGEGADARPLELRARIAHAEGALFGVAFFNPDPVAVGTLLDAARAALPPAPPAPTLAARELVEQLGQQLLSYTAAAFGALFKAADEQLLAAAEHAHSSSEQRLFFEAATQLRKQRDSVHLRYQGELKQSFAETRADSEPAEASVLAQADKEQFEEWLVVKVMAARVEEKCRLPLLALQTRLDALGHAAPGRQHNPFAPAALCIAFQHAIAPLRFGHVVEKVLYRCLEDSVLANLCSVYEGLNTVLAQHNVLPQLDVGKHGLAPAPELADVPAPGTVPTADGVPAPASVVADLAALRAMLALQQELQAGATVPLALPVESAEVKRIFATIKAAGDSWKPALEKLVQHGADNAPAVAVLALQRFADNLVQSLARQEERALAWLGRIEVALLHTLVSDESFFRDPAHPLRRVLECVARLGVKDAPQAEAVRTSVDEVVTRLARDFDAGSDALVQAQAALEPLVASQEQAIRRNRERVCQMAEGEQRLVLARRRVQEALDARLAGKRVPQPLVALLDAGWRDLLTTTWLRHGGDSSVWKDYLGLIDELLAIGADVHREFDLRDLLRLLKTGLEETATVNSRLQQQAIAALKPLLSGPQRLLHDVEWTLLPASKDEGASAEERWLQKWLERAQRLKPGDWLELQHRRAEVECLRLTWRDATGSRFVFVNRQGQKAGDFSRHELASLMHAGNVLTRPGESDSLIDDALAKAGYQLYERLAWQATHDPLTGLANRPEFLRQVERALDAAKRQRVHHVLAVVCLDRFDALSTGAKAVAEQLIKDVAHLLGRALAPRTTVARLGGHEFALLLEECELGKAQQLISLRLGELAAMRPAIAGENIRLSASAGLTDLTYTSDTAESAVAAAADACRQAAENGGNRIQVYHPAPEEQARRDAVMVWVA
ncbi:MAG: diguanylate cyclase, partial [Moraxellaceae bacterium]|nr:diguanylate cyclase [Moraxellaceae bacterium]